MAGVTDLPFRLLCKAQGAGFAYTEMISAKGVHYKSKNSFELAQTEPEEQPAGVQLFGSEPAIMAEAAKIFADRGFPLIDINMGCPMRKITGNGEGSALMRDPVLAGKIIEAVVNAVDVPVTVKFRKGWDGGNVNAVEFARVCEASGASAIAVHGRTRAQMYAGKADWDIIRDVKRAVSIPVFANGDVFSGADAAHILRYTGCDFAMVGRGCFGDPWLFARANAAVNGEPEPPLPPLAERMDAALEQIRFSAEQKGERLACLEARSQFVWYLRGVPHAGPYKQEIVHVGTMEELEHVVRMIKMNLKDSREHI